MSLRLPGKRAPRVPTYPVQSPEAFGAQLLRSGDLDPVYIALNRLMQAKWDLDKIRRWLLAYWCFYDCGVASHMASQGGAEFWAWMRVAAANAIAAPTGARWARAKERRHFRGTAAVNAVAQLSNDYPRPENAVLELEVAAMNDHSYAFVAHHVSAWPLFGPWISFKAADMLDRIGLARVDFSEAEVFMFKDPVEAAMMVWRLKCGLPDSAKPKNKAEVLRGVVSHMREEFGAVPAPPRGERPVDLQEIETILCKWKSHVRGHYPPLNDIREIHAALRPWAKVSTEAAEFAMAMPELR